MRPGHDRDEETLDDLLKGRLKIHQKSGGFKYTVDSLLLAHFASEAVSGKPPGSVRALDLGAGTGVIPLILALAPPIARATGIEIIDEMVEMGRRSIAVNRLEDRAEMIAGDLRNPPDELKGAKFDLVVSNPPYREAGRGRINPDRGKAVARHEISLKLEELLEAAAGFLAPKGSACFIFLASRTVDILSGLREVGIEPVRVRFVHSRMGEDARMTLIQARKSAGRETRIDPPLFIYESGNHYTDEMERIFLGPNAV